MLTTYILFPDIPEWSRSLKSYPEGTEYSWWRYSEVDQPWSW